MKKIITFILLVFSVINLCAQNKPNADTPFPPTYEITTDTISHNIVLPDSNWQMMADPTGKMTLQQVLQSGNFQDSIWKIDYRINNYWLRYRVENKMAKATRITLSLRNVQYADIYVRADSLNWQHYRTGELVPWSQRDGLKSLVAVSIDVRAGESLLVYEHHIFDYKLAQPDIESAGFSFPQRVIVQQRSQYSNALVVAFLLGLILLAVAINLYFYIIVREKEFLYFTLFILVMGILWGLGFEDIFFKDHPAVNWYATIILFPFFVFFLIYSVRHFLKTFARFARWDTYLVVLSFAQAIGYWLTQFGPAFLHKNLSTLPVYINAGWGLLMCLSLLFTIILYRRDKDKVVRMELYALAPFVITLFVNIILFYFNSIKYFETVNEAITNFMLAMQRVNRVAYNVSQVWMIVLFACVLFMRFSSLRRKLAQQELEKEKERNALIAQQKIELEKQVAERTSELSQSLENLKSTQAQLIQSEKMASLGELTAGIAHEIQNPLNFVNNFSDVNKELLDEMKSEILSDNKEEAISIANDVIENSEKINHHGKRADAIVKGMLQHSRTSSGQKEPTDINALCDEYLRLSYHGLRAKDKSFNATMKTDFDESIRKINIVPQDIGRVILNLINNAFYAAPLPPKGGFREPDGKHTPTVLLSTKKEGDKISISISDNRPGIPEKIKDKIFQPFFTTKPTGSGTGLGLSLAYDIVKAHGGEIKVNSNVGQGAEFIITLPDK